MIHGYEFLVSSERVVKVKPSFKAVPPSTLTVQQLKDLTVAKWEAGLRFVEKKIEEGDETDPWITFGGLYTCAFCQRFNIYATRWMHGQPEGNENCWGCPIEEAGYSECEGTPYELIEDEPEYETWEGLRALIEEEIILLRSLEIYDD
jgi:hypothetical protein